MSSRDIANLKNGLVAAWIPSLGSTGYRLVDRVGGNHGLLTGMDAASDWVMSGNGLALDFDGNDDQIEIGIPSGYPKGTPLTLSAWVRLSASHTGGVIDIGGENGAVVHCFALVVVSGKAWALSQNNANNQAISTTTLSNNIWYHLTAVFNSATDRQIYVNGVSENTNTTSTIPDGAFFQRIRIGQRSANATDQNFNGQLDDIRIYSRALSATEVSLLSKERGIGFKTSSRSFSHFAKRYSYKPPKDKTYAAITRSQSDYDSLREGLVLAICPSVSGATGYRAVDVSGRGNHGTLTNMTPEDWVPSGGAGSLDFDGVDDFVSTPTISLGGSAIISWAAWVRVDATSGGDIICEHSVDYNSRNAFIINADSAGVFTVLMSRTSATFPSGYCGADFPREANGVWQHVAVVMNRALTPNLSATRLWINGVEKTGTQPFAGMGSLPGGFDNHACFMMARSGAAFPTDGQLDDIRIYNRALTPPEIRRLASGRGVGLKPTSTQFDYLETREKTYSVIVKSQQEHSSLSEGLVGAWCPSLGASGYRLIDRSGYGNHGTLTNMANDDWVVSGGAGALDFDGTNDTVTLTPPISNTAILTVSGWFYQAAFNNLDHILLEHTADTNTQGNNGFAIAPNYSGGTFMVLLVGPGTPGVNQGYNLRSYTRPTAGRWNHFSAIFNRNLGTNAAAIRLFLNGIEQTTVGSFTQGNVGGNFSNATTFVCSRGNTSLFLAAMVDDIRFHNRALTPPEIRLLASKRGIGLRSQKQTMFYQFPSGSKRRRLLTGMT